MEKGEQKKSLVSVFRTGGEWDEPAIKMLKEMGFSQELPVGDERVPTPKHVFVKYEYGKDPNALRDAILDRIEKTIKKGSKAKTFVVITDDLVPLLVDEVKK
jgi:hypothetical protein